jgi:putative transposase
VNTRNGYRRRGWDTRVGTIELAIPKLRTGSYFPDWLLERRRRAEAALVTVVATSYLLGVSTRRMERLVATSALTGCPRVGAGSVRSRRRGRGLGSPETDT